MRKTLTVCLLLIGCGDDLGWGQQDHDCPDAEAVDVEQDAGDTDAAGDVGGGGDADGGDALDVGGVEDLATGGPDAATEVTDADQTPDTQSADSQADPDVQTAQDSGEDSDVQADDVVPLPAECTEAQDCAEQGPCVLTDCVDLKCQYNDLLLDDTACDTDGTVCTIEKCLGGKCLTLGPAQCDDDEPCTADTCDAIEGCEHWNEVGPCTDSNACTVGDVCMNGACLPGDATTCDDQNVCTDDACDQLVGCTSLPNAQTCTDQNACTEPDQCAGGACVGVEVVCDDNEPCTDDTCAATSGCVHLGNSATCTDQDACTSGDHCEFGWCVSFQISCNDGNQCTQDLCDPVSGCAITPVQDGVKCGGGTCVAGACTCVTGFGCAQPNFVYSGDVEAGLLGGMGGGVGPKMGCSTTDVLIGVGFDFSTGTKTATRTTAVCGTVTVDPNGNVLTNQTTTQKSGGSGCFGWDPSSPTPLTKCPVGKVIVGIKGLVPGTTLFNSVSIICQALGVGGVPAGPTEEVVVPGMPGTGTPKQVMCPAGTIARYFETRAGCGQDALTLYCAKATPDCTGQPLICKD